MADITMCKGTNCPMKYNCHRYTAYVNEYRQTFFAKVPYDKKENNCAHYWNNEGRKKYNSNESISEQNKAKH